jgi:hypothetical protein
MTRGMRALVLVLLLAGLARAEPPALFVVVQIEPARAEFHDAILDEIARAQREHLKPYLEFWAPWCRACVDFKNSLGDARVRAALAGTYIIMINVDDWGDHLSETGFAPNEIPTFYELRADGRPTGRRSPEGGWRGSRPESIARFLARFFHGR